MAKNDAAAEEAWGLLAARLGNKKNRREFVSAFWFSDTNTGATGMLDMLKEGRTSPPPPLWRDAVRNFRAAERAAAAVRKERADAYDRLAALPRLTRERDQRQGCGGGCATAARRNQSRSRRRGSLARSPR